MTMLDEIKQKMHEAVDRAWEALHGTSDLDAARPVAQATTAALQAQALQVEAQLIKHVADNAAAETLRDLDAGTVTVSNEHLAADTPPAQIVELAPGEVPAPPEPAAAVSATEPNQ